MALSRVDVKKSYLWPHILKLHPTINMRVHVHGCTATGELSTLLLQLGSASSPEDHNGLINLPFGHVVQTENELISKMFPNILVRLTDTTWL